jgi:tetratricopeptide (TPR) repeat protein/transcriptional regulator with XRE-family HTH domain
VPARFDVFLSHHGMDKPAIERLARALQGQGLVPWLDAWELTPGGDWQAELAAGLRASRACAVFVGPHGAGSWSAMEARLALDLAAKDSAFRVFPVLLPGVPEPFDPATLPPFLATYSWVDLRSGLEEETGLARLIQAIKGTAASLVATRASGSAPARVSTRAGVAGTRRGSRHSREPIGIDGQEEGAALTFGHLLRRARLATGLTQEALAARAKLSVRAVSDLERGVKSRPHPDLVTLLAMALGLEGQERASFEAARERGTATPDPGRGGVMRLSLPVDEHLPPLVGRAHELSLLERHLAGDGPPVLMLAGEPGIGKTRLLQEAMRCAKRRGWTVVHGGCQRRGGQEPYAPLLEALTRHLHHQPARRRRTDLRGCAWLVRLLPELASGPIEPLPAWQLTPEQERRLMFSAAERFLTNIAGAAGTLLVLDDLQWAGADALDLLSWLVRSLATSLRVVGAYRDTEISPERPLAGVLGDLAQADLAQQLTVGPLAAVEARALLASLLSEQDTEAGARVEEALQRMEGVPFFAVSLARSLQDTGPAGTVPWSVGQSIRQRVIALPAVAQNVLSAAAVLGRVVSRPVLVRMCGLERAAVAASIEAACRARLLEEDGAASYRFVHDLIREVIESDLGSARRAALHQRAGEALEELSGPAAVEALAYHFDRGEAPDRAVLYLELAADKARVQQAHEAAAGHYRALITRLDGMNRPGAVAAVCEKLGSVLTTLAQYDAALVVLERAADTYRAAGDLESLGRVTAQAGDAYAWRGTPEEGVARVRTLLPQLEARGPSPGLARLYTALARLLEISGRGDQFLEAAERAVALARVVQDEHILCRAEYEQGTALSQLGRHEESKWALEAAIAHAEAVDDLGTLSHALDMVGCIYEERGEYAESRAYAERALAVAERLGDPVMVARLRNRRGMSAFFTGDWAGARDDYESSVALNHEVGGSWISPYLLLNLGRLCWAEGAWEEAVRLLDESCGLATASGNFDALRWAQGVLAERDIVTGRAGAARARLVPLLERPGQEEVSNVVLLNSALAWAHLELGELGQADALIEQVIGRMRTASNRHALPEVLRVQALVLARQGRWAEAEGALEEGLSITRAMPYPYAEARLLHVHGQLSGQRGERGAAQERLAAARAIFQRLGARKEIERVEQALASLG